MFSVDGRIVFYDATLQGGPFGHGREIYTIRSDHVARAVFLAKLNAGVSYKWLQLDVEHVFLTREFSTGRNHMWSRVRATIRLRD
jgi:hypothetical protein